MTMSRDELIEIIRKHKEWIDGKPGGERAVLSDADLSGADLRRADLRRADLSGADLSCADLSCADLSGADLRRADLSGAELSCADLRRADLSGADLRGAVLRRADLSGADLRRADLSCADLSGADLRGVIYNESTAFYAMACPEKGAFVGFKKAGDLIVELLIPEDAKRSSATTRKCRCSKAQVISITNPDGTDTGVTSVKSNYRSSFVYTVGKTVEVDDFCEDRWTECAPGIHFFITRDEAVRY